ncbi:MAG: site-specific recombinase [Azoarcus sp.]|nr:site-specific recombinase [Azoarcus sp.]MDD2872755.1 site-specific recombinase [Azoarcus sp.]
MNTLLSRLAERAASEADQTRIWVELVDSIRPPHASRHETASESLRSLTHILARRDEFRRPLRSAFLRLFMERKQVSLYVSSGLLPSTGFFSETARRISDKLLPDVIDTAYMKDVLSVVFHRHDDEVWVNAIADETWIDFVHALLSPEGDAIPAKPGHKAPMAVTEILEALRMLSYHVSAIGLDPDLVRVDPKLEEVESPFLAQNAEIVRYLGHYKTWWSAPDTPIEDSDHLTVMLDQCAEVLLRIRRRAMRRGTSLTLTFKLERLRQHLERIGELLGLLRDLHASRLLMPLLPRAVRLFKRLVHAECRKNRLSDYWGKNVELLSLRMTESASKTGEHYIASNLREHVELIRSAALGGLIIALMAALKILIDRQNFAPLNEILGFCLNYGLGFVLIHVLGGTVATKQPAMTANAIAASIGETRGKTRSLDNLADLIIRTIRSQGAAILGNVGIAVPVAIGLSLAILEVSGTPFIDTAKATALLDEAAPSGSTLFFAAVAGVCLFLSGLISGYYDNLSAYNRVPQRLLQLRWTRRLLGDNRMARVSRYVENNLGALAGNFFFGFLLGGATALGVLFGLPMDIRHIAFSSAYAGYAIAAYDFALPVQVLSFTFGGVLLIGVVNLAVSFTLTLYVAMRARRITFAQGRTLSSLVLRRMLFRPLDLFIAPRRNGPSQRTETGPKTRQNSSKTPSTDESRRPPDDENTPPPQSSL